MTAPDERLVVDVIVRDRDATRTMDRVGDAAVRTGKDFDKAADGAGKLQAEIDQTTINLRELGREFDRTGDRSLLRDIGKERRTLAGLQKLRKEMAGLADAAGDVGKVTSRSLSDALGTLPSQLKGALIVGLAVGAAAAAPAVGAIVGGAIVAGIGAAGVGTGIAAAFQDPKVVEAAGDLGARAKRAFRDASAGMVEPTIESLKILGDAAEDVAREMGGMWDDLAPEVAPLARAIGDMARKAMPGLRDAIEVAKPALRVLAKELPEIGAAFSDMFSTISEEGDGALLGLMALLDGVEGAIRFTGDVVAWLSARFEDLVRAGTAASGAMEDIWGWMPLVGDRLRAANDHGEEWLRTLEESKGASETAKSSFGQVRRSVEDAGLAALTASERFDTLFGRWMSLDQAAIRVEESVDALTASFAENGRTLDINTEKGRANRQALLNGVEAAEQHRRKMIENGQSVAHANDVYNTTIGRLYAQATAAGVSRTELDKLLGKYRDLAKAQNITKYINIKVKYTTSGQAPPASSPGTIYANAKGGIVAAQHGLITDSPTVLFGERQTGREAFIPQLGISRQRGMALAAQAAAWHGASVVPNERMGRGGSGPLVLSYSGGGSGLDELFVSWLHRSIRDGRLQLSAGGDKVRVG